MDHPYDQYCVKAEIFCDQYENFLIQLINDETCPEFDRLMFYVMLLFANPRKEYPRRLTRHETEGETFSSTRELLERKYNCNFDTVFFRILDEPYKLLVALTSYKYDQIGAQLLASILAMRIEETGVRQKWTRNLEYGPSQSIIFKKFVEFLGKRKTLGRAIPCLLQIFILNIRASDYFMHQEICPACINMILFNRQVNLPILSILDSPYNRYPADRLWHNVRAYKEEDDSTLWFHAVISLHNRRRAFAELRSRPAR